MKRALMIVGIVIGVLVVLMLAIILPATMRRRSLTDGVEVNGIHIVKDGMVGIAVIPVGTNQVALIDAGTDKTGKAILAELQRRGLGPDAVVAILLTHGHPDHTAGIALFPKAQVMALSTEVGLVEGTEKAHGPLTQLFPATPTGVKVTPLQDGQTVTVGTTPVQVFAVPGHTAGSAAYLADGVLFLGDAADVSIDGSKIQGSPWVFSDSQPQDRASLVSLDKRLLQQNATVTAIYCAHSGVLTEGLAPLTAYAQANQ